MIFWGWLVAAFVAGTIFGIVMFTLADVSRREDKRKWWDG